MRNKVCSLLALPVILVALSAIRASAQDFLAHLQGVQTGNAFNYTLFNDELTGSPNYAYTFQVLVNAPITVASTPDGWDFETDGATFINWFTVFSGPPYPNDVAPGESLGGFQIVSGIITSELQNYGVVSWDHNADVDGPSTAGFVISPSQQALVAAPEPCTWAFIFLGGSIFGLTTRKRR